MKSCLTSSIWVAIGVAVTACAPDERLAPIPDFVPQRGAVQGTDPLVIGHRLMAAGEYELALNSYSDALATQGITPDVLSALGSANLRLGRLVRAEELLRKATERDQTFVPAWNNLGVALLSQGRAREAVDVFRLAFGLAAGGSEEIRQNLRLAEDSLQKISSEPLDNSKFRLVRQGGGRYLLLGS